MRLGDAEGFLGVEFEIGLRVEIGGTVDDVYGVLVRAHGAVTAKAEEFAGENAHHIAEAMFKAMARALAVAVSIDEKHKNEIPSTKGVL